MREREPIRPASGLKKRLSHENLRVYQAAIEFLALATALIEAFPKGHAQLCEQLRRAALSIPLNIAEAAGRKSKPDSARFFAIARGSALECGAILNACALLKLADPPTCERGKELLVATVSMLSSLSR